MTNNKTIRITGPVGLQITATSEADGQSRMAAAPSAGSVWFSRVVVALAITAGALPASAQPYGQHSFELSSLAEVTTSLAPVLYVYETLAGDVQPTRLCWQALVPESQILLREHNAKPWLLRNVTPLVGAVMGGVVGGLILKRHATALIARRWMLPVIAASGAAGFAVGPGGVAGFVVGGAIGDKLGKGKLPVTIGSAAGGALAGKKLWEKAFPPDVLPVAGYGPDEDIPMEIFVREEVCGAGFQTAQFQSLYRVGYRFNGQELIANLPYDPGEALLVNASGGITGPARVRLD